MGLLLGLGVTNNLKNAGNPCCPGPRDNRSEAKSAFSSPAPSAPHAASSPSSSSKQGLQEFSTVASETSLCWLPAWLWIVLTDSYKCCWNNTLPWITPHKLLLPSPTALTARRGMLMPRGRPLNCMAPIQWQHMYKLAVTAGAGAAWEGLCCSWCKYKR